MSSSPIKEITSAEARRRLIESIAYQFDPQPDRAEEFVDEQIKILSKEIAGAKS